jgi:hypothetical protein
MDTRSAPYEFEDRRGRVSSRAWMRRFAVLGAGAVLLGATGCGSGDGASQAASLGGAATVEATPTPDPAREARSEGARLARAGKYAAAAAAYESADLGADADRVRRRGARALYRSARRALGSGRYSSARKLALESRQLRKTAAARTVLGSANAKIAAAKAAERERRRLARIARDARTCSSGEKTTVKSDGGIPPGCATYAADLAARRAAREAEQAQDSGGGDCDANYTGACLKPDSADYDCEGGSGNGPDYTGPVESVGSDPYDLDRDGDGVACESS